MASHTSLYATLLLSGFLGSLGHCLGMCGPLVMILGLQLGTNGWRSALPRQLLYHAARITVYALLGGIIGAVGSILGVGSQLSLVGGVLGLVLGLLVITLGLGYLGWRPAMLREGSAGWLNRAMSQALQKGGLRSVVLLGALNGLLPCCLVYAALLSAASTGGALAGAQAMLFFGLGTVPALVVVGLGAGIISVRARQVLTRAAGVLMVLVGLQLVLRGGAVLGLVPHLELGSLILW